MVNKGTSEPKYLYIAGRLPENSRNRFVDLLSQKIIFEVAVMSYGRNKDLDNEIKNIRTSLGLPFKNI